MNKRIVAILLTGIMLALIGTVAAYADFGPRFGPWRYFAPYYFPKGNQCKGYCLTPKDYLPKYEDPNPYIPGPPRPF